jgi:hypothetical protein
MQFEACGARVLPQSLHDWIAAPGPCLAAHRRHHPANEKDTELEVMAADNPFNNDNPFASSVSRGTCGCRQAATDQRSGAGSSEPQRVPSLGPTCWQQQGLVGV